MEPEGSLQHSQVPATFQYLPIQFFILDMSQLGHKTRPGHCNMQNWKFSSDWSYMCVSWSLSYSTLFQSDLLPHLQSVGTAFMQVPSVPECRWEGLGNIRHLHECGTQALRVGQQFAVWSALLRLSWLFSSLGRTLSESWMALHWGGCAPGVWT